MISSWNDIQLKARTFINEWKDESRESSEAQTFWNDFFTIFGLSRKHTALFEYPVISERGTINHIDMLWKGKLIVEHKSYGKNLKKAMIQVKDYCKSLMQSDIADVPRYIIVSDFQSFIVTDLEERKQKYIKLEDLADNLRYFRFILGHEVKTYEDKSELNYEAGVLIQRLHQQLVKYNYKGEDMQLFLTRLVLCYFADDTGIFEPAGHFTRYLEIHTKKDGSDMGEKIGSVFRILDTPRLERVFNIDEDLDKFDYLNGDMFRDNINLPTINEDMRSLIIEISYFKWEAVSPAIFGSMFQMIMSSDEQTELGAYFTSEANILKVLDPLFIDDIRESIKQAYHNSNELEQILDEVRDITILDPACGSGDFLIIAYRELRRFETELMNRIMEIKDVGILIPELNVDNFYGIEINDFSVKIAQMGMWMIDHQMNIELSYISGNWYSRIPFVTSPNIVCANSLDIDWNDVVSNNKLTYIVGNPPFRGNIWQTKEQKNDMKNVCGVDIRKYRSLDYVSAWFVKASRYIQNTEIVASFVSTSSIVQGQHIPILWTYLLNEGVDISFAYQPFKWNNDVKEIKNAQVYVVIIGMTINGSVKNQLYIEDDDKVLMNIVKNISPYLIESPDILVEKRSTPISDVPIANIGSMPNDNGYLLFKEKEKDVAMQLRDEIGSEYVRDFIGAREFIHGKEKWCLWLKDMSPKDMQKSSEVMKRLENVRETRLKSTNKATRQYADTPFLFKQDSQPYTNYLLIPLVTSEKREYLTLGYFSKEVIVGNKCAFIPNASLYLFGVLSSYIHMLWTKTVSGRLKNDINYATTIAYNSFHFPKNVSDEQKVEVERYSQQVLDIREKHDSTIAELYNPLIMPIDLRKAHKSLDKAVENCYNVKFTNDASRLKYLFSKSISY